MWEAYAYSDKYACRLICKYARTYIQFIAWDTSIYHLLESLGGDQEKANSRLIRPTLSPQEKHDALRLHATGKYTKNDI